MSNQPKNGTISSEDGLAREVEPKQDFDASQMIPHAQEKVIPVGTLDKTDHARPNIPSYRWFSVAILLVAIFLAFCYAGTNMAIVTSGKCITDYQGHRGCRGLMPENSIPAFLKAMDLSVDTLELDCVISKDRKVVVSHDPYLNHNICYGPLGEIIANESLAKEKYNIYNMNYHSEIEKCDCGSLGNPRFPDQMKMKVHKPLLSQVFDQVEQYIKDKGMKQIWYNIETKSKIEGDNLFHPAPEQFVSLLYQVLQEKNITHRVMIQSFDVRTLQVMRTLDPNIPLALLVEHESNEPFDFQVVLGQLGFLPHIYSPHFSLVTEDMLSFMRDNKIKVIPWTPNTKSDIDKVVAMGVDGIITDYPNIVTNRCKRA